MPKKIIAVDADDTLFDENTAIRLFMNNTHGFKHTAEDYSVPGQHENYFQTVWNLNPTQTRKKYEEFIASSYKAELKPIKDAITVVQRLKQNYELVIVTARDHRTVEITHNALKEHYPNIFGDVHFTPLWGKGEQVTKAKICQEIGASYLIDDSFEHCQLAAEAGVQAIVFGDYGWNRDQELLQGMTRCKNWKAVEQYLLS